MTPEERVREAALEAGMDPEQALAGLARRKANSEGVPQGQQWCSMSSHYRPEAEFEGRRTCSSCRAMAREAMRNRRNRALSS